MKYYKVVSSYSSFSPYYRELNKKLEFLLLGEGWLTSSFRDIDIFLADKYNYKVYQLNNIFII